MMTLQAFAAAIGVNPYVLAVAISIFLLTLPDIVRWWDKRHH